MDGQPIAEKEDAANAADGFISDNLSIAVTLQLKYEAAGNAKEGDGNSPEALWYFGQALHTTTDGSSLFHDYFKTTWGLGKCGSRVKWGTCGPAS